MEELLERTENTRRRYDERQPRRHKNLAGLQAFLAGKGTLDAVDDSERIARRWRREGETVGRQRGRVDGGKIAVPTVSPDLRELLERAIGRDDTLGARFLYAGADAARAVGRVVVRTPRGSVRSYGTGFLVAPGMLMTNEHVLRRSADAEPSVVEFGYYELPGGRHAAPLEFQLLPGRLFVNDRRLDYALVAVSLRDVTGAYDVTSLGWHPLDDSPEKVERHDRLNLVQHPKGGPQRCALRDNKLVDVLDDHFHYESDTERGSSGSPVFSDNWELVALHHSGVPKRNAEGRYVHVDGGIWDEDEHHIDQLAFVANEGIRIERIYDQLSRQRSDLPRAQRAALEGVLDAPPPTRLVARDVATRLRPSVDDAQPAIAPSVTREASQAFSVSLRISVDNDRVVSVSAGDITSEPRDPPPTDPAPPDDGDDIIVDGRTWLDRSKNAADRDAYYDQVPDTGDPFDALSQKLRNTHDDVLGYSVARYDHLYPWVDVHEDGKLRSLYSGKRFTVNEVLRMERDVERKRVERLHERIALEGFASGAEREAFEDLLERALRYNCEHVVPQSWFQKRSPMKTDLHHLFTCESGCNSFRSNLYFFDFPPGLEGFRQDCGQTSGRRFEPAAGKGAAARATLYFLLRYPGKINDVDREMPDESLETLLSWHTRDPVSDWERHRNAGIAEAQGNRNPLIDHPAWAERIDFKRGWG